MSVKVEEIVSWLDQQLNTEHFSRLDAALNGLQVGDLQAEVDSIAVACDACDEVIARAAEQQLLLVHHGLFWGPAAPITGRAYRLVSQLVRQNCALYASHLPLDAHQQWGNNAVLAKRLGLEGLQPFAHIGNQPCGLRGALAQPQELSVLARQVFPECSHPQLFPFGAAKPQTVAICSGSGGFALQEAIDSGADVLVMGDINHSHYHRAREAHLSVITGGHYYSEIVGVQALGQALAQHFSLRYQFIDFPTGL